MISDLMLMPEQVERRGAGDNAELQVHRKQREIILFMKELHNSYVFLLLCDKLQSLTPAALAIVVVLKSGSILAQQRCSDLFLHLLSPCFSLCLLIIFKQVQVFLL
jgi:hypothetical protein